MKKNAYLDSDYALALSMQEEIDVNPSKEISPIYIGSKRSFNQSSSSSSSSSSAPPISNQDDIESLDRIYAEQLNEQLSSSKPSPISNKRSNGGRGRGNGKVNGRGNGRGNGRNNWNNTPYRTFLDDELHIPYHQHSHQIQHHPIRHPLLPSNIDPKLLELMTRDINANDYEFLIDHFDDDKNKKGLTDVEIDNFLNNFTYQTNNKKLKKDNIIDLCNDDNNNHDIIFIDVESDKIKINDELNNNTNDNNNKENECSICLTPFVCGEELSILPCLHKYHRLCIKNWLKISRKCPIDNIEF